MGSDLKSRSIALARVIEALNGLDSSTRKRILQSARVFFDDTFDESDQENSLDRHTGAQTHALRTEPKITKFSDDRTATPKEFMLTKKPRTDVEKIACLAYYLTHYRDTPTFKTEDLSRLNTEAAQPRFSNAANAANNALKRRYLAPAAKGQKQISATGELFVLALPDRESAKEAMITTRPRTSRRKKR